MLKNANIASSVFFHDLERFRIFKLHCRRDFIDLDVLTNLKRSPFFLFDMLLSSFSATITRRHRISSLSSLRNMSRSISDLDFGGTITADSNCPSERGSDSILESIAKIIRRELEVISINMPLVPVIMHTCVIIPEVFFLQKRGFESEEFVVMSPEHWLKPMESTRIWCSCPSRFFAGWNAKICVSFGIAVLTFSFAPSNSTG
mmetsp:Transcript_7169/g.17448  ORF Transcript_7169/g.17448 Transcript_7169/m.17448 type:complete len:203 (-) Transcript_7169:1742-2350(-)